MTEPPAPLASVVVATHQRATSLERLLRALDRQEGVAHYEVIVVDNASGDATADLLARFEPSSPSMRLRSARMDRNAGPGPARNRGWRMAAAPVVVFTDDDCEPPSRWLAGLLAAMDGDAGVVTGPTLPIPADLHHRGPFSHMVRILEPSPWFECCNIAYRRELLDRLGGFDESFGGRSFGEDVDLGWRAVEAGARTGFAPDAVMYHAVGPSDPVDYLRRRGRVAGIVRLVAKHPGVRPRLPDRWFYLPSHRGALLTAAALAFWSRRPGSAPRAVASLAATAAYVRDGIRHERMFAAAPSRLPAVVALVFVGDLIEVGAMAYGSVKHRTFLL